MSAFKFDPNSTKNEGRWRLKDPDTIVNYRRWKFAAGVGSTDGVSYVVGHNANTGKTEIQAIRFDKRIFTEAQAAVWWEENKHLFEKTWTEADWKKWEKEHG